jgi:predicted  nucleic acid-binding Zn-ribbon protein
MLRQLTDIEDRMRRGPIQIRLVKTTEQGFLEAAEEKKQELLAAQKEARSKQAQLDDREAKLEDLRGKLNTADSNKEYQLLKDRIAADEQANSVQTDEIFETLEKIDVLKAELETANSNLEKAKSETAGIEKKVAEEQIVLKNDDARVREELEEALKGLHPDLRVPYERNIKSMGEDTFASTDTKTCGNCNLTLTSQTASDLLSCKPMVCNGCGSILYREK